MRLALVALLASGACGSPDPREVYNRRIKEFAQAAVSMDSVRLRNLSVSDATAGWALDAARRRSPILSGLHGYAFSTIADTSTDTVAVVFQTGGECTGRPIIVSFVGPAKESRVARIESDCR